MRPVLSLLLALALAGCSAARPEPRKATGPVIHSVRFGADADQLLLTVCGPDGATAGDPCAVLIDDLTTNTAVRVAPPPGRSLAYPTRGPDGGIVAATLDLATDAAGNKRSSLVAFSADGTPIARTLVSASRALIHPDVFDGQVYAFLQKCLARTDRYCEHEVVRVEDGRLRMATPRGVGLHEVTRIVAGGEQPIVWGNLPGAVLTNQEGFVEYAGSTNVWRLMPAAPFGLGKLSETVDPLAAAPDRTGAIIAFATGAQDLGLDRLLNGATVRITDYPKDLPSIGRGVLDMDVSGNGSAVLLWSATADNPAPELVLFDGRMRSWRTVPMPRIVSRVSIAVEPETTHGATRGRKPAA